ncbi:MULTISPECIES: hypothetical protein [Rhodopirellula]|nr:MULTISPECIES: hypothetical protein [Rhodopirellula]
MKTDFFWICPKDVKDQSWLFYEIKEGKLVKNSFCQSMSCPRCGKFDELSALISIDDLSISVNATADWCLSGDGVILVSSRIKHMIISEFLDECNFIDHSALGDYSICIPANSFAVDAATSEMEFHRQCKACGRYRETCGFPVVSKDLTANIAMPTTFFENVRGRVFFYACSKKFKAALLKAKARGIYFDSVVMRSET